MANNQHSNKRNFLTILQLFDELTHLYWQQQKYNRLIFRHKPLFI